jgi:hypothetical protein
VIAERRPVEAIDDTIDRGEGGASDEPQPRAAEESASERRPVEAIEWYPMPVGRHPPASRSDRPFVPGAGWRFPPHRCGPALSVGQCDIDRRSRDLEQRFPEEQP